MFITRDINGLIVWEYSGTSVHERLSLRTNRFTNKFSEQKTSRVTNGVWSNEHASRQQRLATSWEYRRESVSCCITFAQYTSLLEFVVPSLEFHCVLCFFKYIIKYVRHHATKEVSVYEHFGWRTASRNGLTFRNHASYIKDGHTATLQTPHFIYFFNKFTYKIF
jgi:hypothetical protein